MTSEHVRYEKREHTAWITLNRLQRELFVSGRTGSLGPGLPAVPRQPRTDPHTEERLGWQTGWTGKRLYIAQQV